ncbi:MAG: fatty acid desaturase CarF family protein [Opitutaceae bacterium]|nr:fatty acid desaturase CarF family protein [Opitutaceae bacterium]
MRSLLLNFAQALGVVLIADFVAGAVHWLEDAYGSPDTPVIGPLVIRPNIVHHHHPRFFTRLTWWQSSRDLLLLCVALVLVAWWFDFLTWHIGLFAFVSANANQVHKWSHQTRKENGRIVSFFQDIGVLLTPKQHALHHSDPKNTFYCPVTNLVNPLLECIRFWHGAEWLIARATGMRHRPDTSNRGHGPAPAWLAEYSPARPVIGPVVKNAPCATCPRRLDPSRGATCRGTCSGAVRLANRTASTNETSPVFLPQ